jgi:Asp-tRNA(Asn)/Glu-tRNA(Gln) amidotransferase B subunit
VLRIADAAISGKIAGGVSRRCRVGGESADAIIAQEGSVGGSPTPAPSSSAVDDVMAERSRPACRLPLRQGQLVRLLRRCRSMKATGGKANPGATSTSFLKKKLAG